VLHVVQQIPSDWLGGDRDFSGDDDHRAAYVDWFRARREAIPILLEEANRAHASIV
jgi:hypothetical protein